MPQHQRVQVAGRQVTVSNLDKVLYPATGTTKRDVIAYYSAIADTMLPHCRDRPATRKRWPNGVGEDGAGAFFFQKDIGEGAPEWVATGDIQHRDHVNTYPLVNDEATLVWLAQLAALEIHVPQWRFDGSGSPANPDRIVFDLDPGEGVTLRECARAAFLVRDILADMGLPAIPVTSGSKGIHLYAALDGSWTSDEVSGVAKQLARALETDHPDEITSNMKRALRAGKVFIDWSQNNSAKTTVAPYSLRGRVRPTVAVPRTWRELASPHLRQLEYAEVLRRVARRGDPLADLRAEPAQARPSRTTPSPARPDPLRTYRSKRNAARTPEPVPEPGKPGESDDDPIGRPRFVIQRHEARRLHFDFRLEHDGVLVSWALPKGVPTDPNRNHLAVPTEDHPLAYRHFAGTIPKGEYGAGTVRIWDAGTCDIEKWSETEVMVTLNGRHDGGLGGAARRFALFRTGADPATAHWMIHLMSPRPVAREPSRAPGAFAPMLATAGTPAELARLDDEWAYEMKWDGIRALATVDGSGCTLTSRSGAALTGSYPELLSLGSTLNADAAVLDGEIVAFDPAGAPSFSALQRRFGATAPGEVERLRRAVPAAYLIFDVLSINGRDCRALEYAQRRELLAQLFDEPSGRADRVPGSPVPRSPVPRSLVSDSRGPGSLISESPVPGPPISVPPVWDGGAQEALEASARLSLEGIVAKRRSSQYHSGTRSADWLKFPLRQTSEAIVIAWRASLTDTRGFASLLLAEPSPSGLRYVGRVGTGFTAAERRSIRARLDLIQQPEPAAEVPREARRDAHWVAPELVCEVHSKGRTATGSFRQPVWRGWRPDKLPSDISTAHSTSPG